MIRTIIKAPTSEHSDLYWQVVSKIGSGFLRGVLFNYGLKLLQGGPKKPVTNGC